MSEVRLDGDLQRGQAPDPAEFLALHDVPACLESGAVAHREPVVMTRDQQHHAALRQTARDLREFVAAIDRRLPRVEGPRERTIAIAAELLRHEAMARIRSIDAELAGERAPFRPPAID
jgi:hypothetical protein